MGYEIKKIYLNNKFDIIDGNREYFIYFERVGHRFSRIAELVLPDEKKGFELFLKSNPESERYEIFHFKKYTEEYRLNRVSVNYEILNGKKTLCVNLVDIEDVFGNLENLLCEEDRKKAALSIMEEYFFAYEKNTNKFKLHHYHDGERFIDFNSDIDEWKIQMTEERFVPSDQISAFEKLVSDLKSCPVKIFEKLTCAFRTNGKIMQPLDFLGVRFVDKRGNINMIGRVISDSKVHLANETDNLITELQFDSLTKCYNKKTIQDYIIKKLKKAEPGEKVGIAIVDLDNFKPVNDAYGHLAGDQVLEQTGEVLRNIVGDRGRVGRYGGDEFLLVMNHMDREEILRGILQTILNNIRTKFETMFGDIKITPSIGASVYPDDGDSYEELFKKADFCLYRAKDKGRNRYIFFRNDLHLELYKQSVESTSGVKYQGREIQELKYMAQFMHNLSEAPFKAIKTVTAHMVETYRLGDISIYYGEEMKRIYCAGEKCDSQNEASYAASDSFKLALKGSRFVRVDFPEDVADAKEFHDILNVRGIKSTIQCILGTKEDVKGLITFDKLKESQQWAEYEVNCAVMFASSFNLLSESTKYDFAIYSKLKEEI